MESIDSIFLFLCILNLILAVSFIVNCKTGDLSMECNSTNCFAIRELVIRDNEENKIYGTLINGI